MELTEEIRANISQLIRMEATHELGMQQAKVWGYDEGFEWDYRIDYWYMNDVSSNDFWEVRMPFTIVISGSFRVIVAWHHPYVLDALGLKEGDYHLCKEKGCIITISLFYLDKQIIVSGSKGIIKGLDLVKFIYEEKAAHTNHLTFNIDRQKVKDYIFQQIQNNRSIFEPYINKVPNE